MPDLAVGRHHLQPKAQLAHVAVAQHLHPAGVGGQVAADGAAAFRGQRQRKQPPMRRGGFLSRLQRAAGLHHHRAGQCIHAADLLHP